MKTSIAGILINGGKIFIAKRKSLGEFPANWEFPGGKMEFGETPEQCLRRAMQEEFRMSVKISDLFSECTYDYGQGTAKIMAFKLEWDGGDIISLAHDDFKWVDIGELRSYDFAPADIPLVEKLMSEEYGY